MRLVALSGSNGGAQSGDGLCIWSARLACVPDSPPPMAYGGVIGAGAEQIDREPRQTDQPRSDGYQRLFMSGELLSQAGASCRSWEVALVACQTLLGRFGVLTCTSGLFRD